MSIYSKRVTGIGATIYIKDRRPTKTADVPGNIVTLLETQAEVDDTQLNTIEKPYKKCIFDGMATKLYRVANGQTLDVCEEHYHNCTLGQLVQQARLNEEPVNEEVN